jgi:hypothetical protein
LHEGRRQHLIESKTLQKNRIIILGRSANQAQSDLFKSLLAKQLKLQHPLYVLGQFIPWKELEESFDPLYGHVGLPLFPKLYMLLR